MFEEGIIIYFDPFYFKKGNPAKPKYFVVLKIIGEQSVLASLPTRKDSIPQKDEIDDGCLELPDINLNCFVISNETEVTECGKKFDFKTHIYGHELDTHEIEWMKETFPNEGTDYIIWGKMKPGIFNDLTECFKNSRSVRRKFQRILKN